MLNDDFRTIHGVEPVVIQASVGDIQKIFEFSLILGNVWLHNTDFGPPLSIREGLILVDSVEKLEIQRMANFSTSQFLSGVRFNY